MSGKLAYWVMFDEDEKARNANGSPHRIVVSTWVELMDTLTRYAGQRGPITWMQRDYTVGPHT